MDQYSTSQSSAHLAHAALLQHTVRCNFLQMIVIANSSTEWEDVSIVLNKADQSFLHSGNWQYSATGGKMSTPDSGKTWNFTTLSIPDTPVS